MNEAEKQKLIEELATKVMRWKKKVFQETGLFNWVHGNGHEYMGEGWNPLENWNHTMEVENQIRRTFSEHWPHWESKNGNVEIVHTVIYNDTPNGKVLVENSSRQEAICLAALKAVESGKPS